MKEKILRLIFLGMIIFAVTFQPLYPQQPDQYLIKIDKTKKITGAILQHKEILILHELSGCYLGVTDEETASKLNAVGATIDLLDKTTWPLDYYFMVYLVDLNHLDELNQNGTAILIEGHNVVFRPSGSLNPRQIFPGYFRGIKRLAAAVKIGPTPPSIYKKYETRELKQIDPVITQMAGLVSKENIRNNIQTLQDFVTRDARTDKCDQAGKFLYDNLLETGLQVSYDPFNFEGYTADNIIGYLPGKTDKTSIVIIGAHYDSYASPNSKTKAPGADDNASGSAAVLEAAKILSKYSFDYSIKFILFSAEEWGLYGSAHYAQKANQNGENIIGVINLDMVSFADSLPEDLDVIVNTNSKWMQGVLENAIENYSSISANTTLDNRFDYSDHYSFWDEGFPAVLCIEDYDDTNPYYHTNNDTLSTINLDFATEVTKSCLAATAQLAQPISSSGASVHLNRTRLNFCALSTGAHTGTQEVWISNSGSGTLNWSASKSVSWLNCTPVSGVNNGIISVSINPTGLGVGAYTGTISITDPNAGNSPQTLSVTLTVKSSSQKTQPFGEFSTPVNGSTVRSSIPVTGWVLDDIGVQDLKIYREEGTALVLIGSAVFIEGARPDVETAYSNYPFNYKAGWGYMLLSNFLPNGGNGVFKLHAIATDLDGNSVDLGVKTITIDNTHAVKPFGAIDTPTQGGTTSGNNYINWGWALTPQPNIIPTNGSTINVWVDGVSIGRPVFNNYREDIASLFPGFRNSNGAIGYFYLNTSSYSNGTHTIYWTVTDNAGNSDGIGSRYFSVMNENAQQTEMFSDNCLSIGAKTAELPLNYQPVYVKKGPDVNSHAQEIYPDEKGVIHIQIEELERLEIHLASETVNISPLPVGSTLDKKHGVFYWSPGPGFIGEYRFLFAEIDSSGNITKKRIDIKIIPK